MFGLSGVIEENKRFLKIKEVYSPLDSATQYISLRYTANDMLVQAVQNNHKGWEQYTSVRLKVSRDDAKISWEMSLLYCTN